MKRVYFLSAFVILLLLSGNLLAQELYSLETISEEEFLNGQKNAVRYEFDIDTTNIFPFRWDTSFSVSLHNSKELTFKGDEEVIKYFREWRYDTLLRENWEEGMEYIGFIKNLDSYLFILWFADGGVDYLINKTTGQISEMTYYFAYNEIYSVFYNR